MPIAELPHLFPGIIGRPLQEPLITPPVVTSYLLLLLLGRRGPLGQFLDEQFGIVFAFRWTGAALACAGMAFPDGARNRSFDRSG